MTNTEIKKMLENLHQQSIRVKYSLYALDAIANVLSEYNLEKENTLTDFALAEADSQITYNSQAFNYLMDENHTDFTEAIEDGCARNVRDIAVWYLIEEIMELIIDIS